MLTVWELNLQTTASSAVVSRTIAWFAVAATFFFLVSCVLTFGFGWPGIAALFQPGSGPLAWAQLGGYALCLVGAFAYATRVAGRPLRHDADIITGFVAFLVRAAFWAVLLVGLADAALSFLRVEGLLETVFGSQLATQIGLSKFRGMYVHLPLIGLAFAIAALTRGLGFIWLGFLVVIAELAIVISRFVFSYEQAFQGDLVRFWYAALFLFASAYTLVEEGHVRVDVVYASLSQKAKGYVNYFGSLFMGISLSVVILVLGTMTSASSITGPLLNFEVSQSGFGMYVKYLMAGFLGVFALTMLIQFAGYMLSALADIRGEPGGREHSEVTVQ